MSHEILSEIRKLCSKILCLSSLISDNYNEGGREDLRSVLISEGVACFT